MDFKPFTSKGVFLRKDAFFIGRWRLWVAVLLAIWLGEIARADCTAPSMDAYVGVASVVDGDTIRLADQTLVRLIGINTPEIDHDGGDSQPLAHAARQFLETRLTGQGRVGLVYGVENRDRYGRRLAHVFVEQGDTRLNVQKALLENGLAMWVAIAPNTRYLTCYQAAEAKARQQGIGIWREAYFRPKDASNPRALNPGFQRLQGKIVAVFQTKNYFWLKFNDTVALRIAPKDIHNFDLSRLRALDGKFVEARGWLSKYQSKHQGKRQTRLTMQISHPAAVAVQAP